MLYTHDEDTIAAISTPTGEGGIGIIRISGTQALEIVHGIFRGTQISDIRVAPTYSIHYGYIVTPDSHSILDETLVTIMRAPRSYTKEDVVEINCHGGPLPLRNVLELVLSRGARLATPGEFTKRAFLNGRIDLSQAESVIDIIRAKTDASLQLAVQQLRGKLSEHLQRISSVLKHLLASIEASIDFPEDEIEIITPAHILSELEQLLQHLQQLLASAHEGKIVRDGLSLAIVGKPNVGKSSLLNLFLKEERAIVTPLPGTTRDTIEDYLNLHGVPIRLLDTAGIRESQDHLEMLGVARSREVIKKADLTLCMFDASVAWSPEDEELLNIAQNKDKIIIVNKSDLPIIVDVQTILHKLSKPVPAFQVSVKTLAGINELQQAIVDYVMDIPLESVEVTNVRHKHALNLAHKSLLHAYHSAETNMSPEFMALDLRDALNYLGEITGETTTEDLLDLIFSTFCIGK